MRRESVYTCSFTFLFILYVFLLCATCSSHMSIMVSVFSYTLTVSRQGQAMMQRESLAPLTSFPFILHVPIAKKRKHQSTTKIVRERMVVHVLKIRISVLCIHIFHMNVRMYVLCECVLEIMFLKKYFFFFTLLHFTMHDDNHFFQTT